MNPKAVEHINTYTYDLIRQVSSETKAAIQQTLNRAFTNPEGALGPAVQAREIRDSIGLTARQEQAVANYRAALETGDFQNALDRALRDGRFDRAILNARNGGTNLSQAQIDKFVERYRTRYISYRATTIARTESIRSSVKGERESWRQAKAQGLLGADIERQWRTAGDDSVCDECDALDDETVDFEEEFPDGDPPLHPACRCRIVLVHATTKRAIA
jgi:SPP1 gp7 family putative phage head morphogenesis protein